MQLTRIRADFHTARAINLNVRIDGLTVEHNVAGASNFSLERSSAAAVDIDAARTRDFDVERSVDRSGAHVTRTRNFAAQSTGDRSDIDVAAARDFDACGCSGRDVELATSRDFDVERLLHGANLNLA